ncbi:MAG: hypothetical protein Q4B50_08390 [Bacillota bacterium]|nr:hypothetical protein [Bacillota bacterium]
MPKYEVDSITPEKKDPPINEKIPFQTPLYKAVRENPAFLDQKRKDLISCPEVQRVLNGKSSTMLNAMGGHYFFTTLVDSAIKHVDKLNRQRQQQHNNNNSKIGINKESQKKTDLLVK